MTKLLGKLEQYVTSFEVDFSASTSKSLFFDLSPKEITLTESLLTPGLQTAITFQSYAHNPLIKNLDTFKAAIADIKIGKPILKNYGYPDTLELVTRIYRMDNRNLITNRIEEFTLRSPAVHAAPASRNGIGTKSPDQRIALRVVSAAG